MTNLLSFANTIQLLDDDCSIQQLAGILADSSKFYRSFEMPKRSGGVRKIDVPYPILARVQKTLFHHLRNYFHVGEHAYAFCSGKNAIMHAEVHLGCDELLTVDIENFFGSITRQQIQQSLLSYEADNSFAHIASLISTRHGVLPQGASTSPLLSNWVFSRLDIRFSRLAAHLGLVYSRYADDLAFSGKHIPRNLPSTIRKILSSQGYVLNPSKTKLKVQGTRKIITGVSISSGALKAPRVFVRTLRAEVHHLERNVDHLSTLICADPLIYERVIGKLNYWLQIEPDNGYALEKRRVLSVAHQRFLNLSSDFNLSSYLARAA